MRVDTLWVCPQFRKILLKRNLRPKQGPNTTHGKKVKKSGCGKWAGGDCGQLDCRLKEAALPPWHAEQRVGGYNVPSEEVSHEIRLRDRCRDFGHFYPGIHVERTTATN